MKGLHFVTICLMLVSCQPKVITELRTEYVTRDSLVVRDTTIYVKLPQEVKEVVVYPKDTSDLETSLAESRAYVDSLGLHHSLKNKDRDWGVTIPKVTRIVAKAQESTQIRTVEKEVERDFTWWEKVRLRGFWAVVALAVVGWRKEIWKILKRVAAFFCFG